jgi:hypothetical protein
MAIRIKLWTVSDRCFLTSPVIPASRTDRLQSDGLRYSYILPQTHATQLRTQGV